MTAVSTTRRIRPVTLNMVDSIMLDNFGTLRPAALVDFGIDSEAHYEALYYPVRAGDITPEALDAALGDGPALTKLVDVESNPHKGIVFKTAYDGYGDDDGGDTLVIEGPVS